MNDSLVELSVLGGLMLDSSKLLEIDLVANDFENSAYGQVFQTISTLFKANEPIDLVTVADRLEKETGKNWLSLVGHLVDKTPTAANVLHYANLVKRRSLTRHAMLVADQLKSGVEADGEAAIDSAIRQLMEINMTKKNYEHSASESAHIAIKHVDEIFHSGEVLTGISTGLVDLNEKMGGLHKSDLIIVGGRPAMGKTAFMLNLANNANAPVGIISGEQGHEQVGLRLVSVNGSVDAHALRLAKLNDSDWPKITKALNKIGDKSIWIFDKPAPTLGDVIRQARRWKHEKNIGILFVDYIQRIRVRAATRREEVAEIAQTLKELARELNIPVVALAQVNRKVEDRPNKRPLLSDLKEAGEIEQEADIIMMLYRDEVYNPDTSAKGILEIGIGKNRHGPTGIIRCTWIDKFMQTQDIKTPIYWGQ